jgi:hypothetical protein
MFEILKTKMNELAYIGQAYSLLVLTTTKHKWQMLWRGDYFLNKLTFLTPDITNE